jgi:glycosyltransferase involved in cell wall biosynthesis
MRTPITITVITVVLNDERKIESTIKSIISQSYRNIEYIIIDGGSVDNTLQIIENYKDRISLVISEPDNGIYHAMNKGIRHASGDYIIFINSGDIFYNNDIIKEVFTNNQDVDFIIGDVEFNIGKRKIRTRTPKQISFYLLYIGTIYHQATFTKKAVFSELGGYNELNRITSDWEYITLALAKHRKTYKILDSLICKVDHTGISSLNPDEIEIERSRMLKLHFEIFITDYYKLKRLRDRTIYMVIKKIYRFIRKQYYRIGIKLFLL